MLLLALIRTLLPSCERGTESFLDERSSEAMQGLDGFSPLEVTANLENYSRKTRCTDAATQSDKSAPFKQKLLFPPPEIKVGRFAEDFAKIKALSCTGGMI